MQKPNWKFWHPLKRVELWQAIALSLDLNPDDIIPSEIDSSTQRLSIYGWKGDTDISANTAEQFAERLRLLYLELCVIVENKIKNGSFRKFSFATQHLGRYSAVRLDEFAAWGLQQGFDMPPELVAMTQNPSNQEVAHFSKNVRQSNPLSPLVTAEASLVNGAKVTSEPAEDKSNCESSSESADAELAALFDPVTVAALEKMFPADGKWNSWAERAARNNLQSARTGRGLFNPYTASVWFLNQGEVGWDIARCKRALAKNLPARSIDKTHLLTSELPD